MGAGFFTEMDSKRISDLATEINGQFSKDFSIAFKDAIINHLKSTYLQGSISKNALMQYENASQDIKGGFLLKIGGNVKSWKNRYFVAKNKLDNYAIVYYEDENMKKEKGRFCCCGYQVEAFSAEEVTWYGVYGIKLTSYDETKRQWLFRARSDPEQSEWLEVLMNACKKAKPEPLKEQVYIDAYKSAFSATKAAYGYFGVCFIFGTECEMLEHLTNQILSREILDDYILERAKTQPANAKALVLEMHRHVQKIVKPIIYSSWENCYNAVRVLKAPFELSVKASLRQYLQKETEIKSHLEPKIRAIVLPHLGEIENTICVPILNGCVEPILQAYEQAVEGLQVELCSLIHVVEPYADAVSSAHYALQLSVEQGCVASTSSLEASQKLLWTMHTEDLLDLQDIFEISGLAGFDIYSNALDDLKVLTQNAIYTFGKMAIPGTVFASDSPTGSRPGSPVPGGSSKGESKTANGSSDSSSVEPGKSGAEESKSKHRRHHSPQGDGGGAGDSSKGARSGGSTKSQSRSRHKGRSNSGTGRSTSAGNLRIPLTRTVLMQALNQVIIRMSTDSVLSMRAGLAKLLIEAMEAKVQECMISACPDEVKSAASLVTRDMQLMINLNSIGENMIREMVADFVHNMLAVDPTV